MKTRLAAFFGAALALTFLTSCRPGGDLESVSPYTQYHGVTFVEKFKVWATGADEPVGPRSFYEPSNYIFDGEGVRLYALRGGTTAFQLVVSADYGNVNDVRVAAAALKGPGDAVVAAGNVAIYFEYFLDVKTPSGYYGRAGGAADPLLPNAEPFDLAKAESQPFMVVITVPADAAPGTYVGALTVSAKGAQSQRLKVELNVAGAALDEALRPLAFIEPDYRALAAWEKGDANETLSPKQLAPYFLLLSSRGVRPLDGGYGQRRLTAGAGRAAKDWAKAAKGQTGPAVFYLSGNADGSPPAHETLAEEYAALYAALIDDGDLGAAIVWTAFEGGSPSPFARGVKAAAWWDGLAKAAASWPGKPTFMAATSPFRGAPDVNLRGAVAWWLPTFADVAACPERYANIPGGGDYLLRVDGSGADFLDGRRAAPRLLSWYGYLWGARGLAALVPPADAVRAANPWRDDPLAGSAAAYGNGFGVWFYPGKPAGVDGAVASRRLELLRQGLEDWALFRLAEKKVGAEYVRERLMALLPYDVDTPAAVEPRRLANNQIYELREEMFGIVAGRKSSGREVNVAGKVVDALDLPVYHARVGDNAFATYTDEAGAFLLRYRRDGRNDAGVVATGAGRGELAAGVIKLRRGLRGLEPVFDFESGVDGSFWLSGDAADAKGVAEERELVHEGRVAMTITFPCGRTSRAVNLYPRRKEFGRFHSFEFDLYNANGFIVDVWLLLMDDEAAEPATQYRRRVTLRPNAWTRVALRVKDLPTSGESEFRPGPKGGIAPRPAYNLEVDRIIGVGFESDGLAAAGGKDNAGSYRVVVDYFKVVIFE